MKLSLRALRINAGLSRDDVAKEIGMSSAGYRRIEAEEGKGMKAAQLLKLCKLYGVDADTLNLNLDAEDTNIKGKEEICQM